MATRDRSLFGKFDDSVPGFRTISFQCCDFSDSKRDDSFSFRARRG
jgi:hypothetical protein